MNDSQVKQQIQQMVSFIKQEAEDKANEIRTKAEEDFNIRKQNAVNEARLRIHAEYSKKTKQIDVNRRIAASTEQNAARLQVLKARDQVLREAYDDAAVALADIPEKDAARYGDLLHDIVLQGLVKLGDEEVVVRCRKADYDMLSDIVPSVSEIYISKTGKPLTLRVDDQKYLPDSTTGGVVLLSDEGRIVVENTFASRLEIAFQQNLPAIRTVLFPVA